ncbi:hypothetical protein [Microbispora sp. ATCC PTA-5024]|uniref:hypothetical protein n=1 Tax=Microbispora sp. ATCC PTA-5024 TaxID=316330 RepID=UPI0012EEC9FC|nr:hypothetical protein [Microbispora sp. ATCC PTA-5024]
MTLKLLGALIATAVTSATTTVAAIYLTGHLATDTAPSEIKNSCRAFIATYDEAFSRAKQQNDQTLQTELAHPWRVSDVWRAKNQAALEDAALQVQNLEGDWAGVAWQLVQAATSLGANSQDSAVDREAALSTAHAACLAR